MNAAPSSGEARFDASGSGASAEVRFEVEGPVATVTLDRPEVLNAQTPALWADLRAFGRSLPGDVRVVVVRGSGRAFSAGLDTSVAASLLGGVSDAQIAQYQEAFAWLRQPSLISIAAVHGHAIGAGFQLALACDFRVVAEDVKFCMAEVSLGLVPDLGGTKRLVELVGYARALELCVTGRRVMADEASQIGLANVVVPAAELTGAVGDLTAAVLAGPRDAIVEIKALIAAAGGHTFAQQEAVERAAQVRRIQDLAGLGE